MRFGRRRFAQFACAAIASAAAKSEEGEAGFRPLFDGRTLTGWDLDERLWIAENGVLVGTTEKNLLDHDEFAIARGRFTNFVFRTEIKLRNHHSGIQFRSVQRAEWAVTGLQAAAGEGSYWGSIYDEGGRRGIIVNGWPNAQKVVRPADWNEYEISCNGGDIRLRLNGADVAGLRVEKAEEGVIALGLMTGPAMQVSFRNIRIRASAS